MKTIMTLMLGLSVLGGATAVFAKPDTTKPMKKTSKAKKAKKTDTTSTGKKS